MSIRERLSGNEAIATAMRQINPDVVAAFPITPSTEIPQYFSSYVANGKVDSVFVPVESEHSAMSATIGASAAGARAMTATSSCGLAYMWEMLYVAASDRLPLALALVNRALSGPININCDHSDAMGAVMPAGSSCSQKITRKLMIIWSWLSVFPSIRMSVCRSWSARMALSSATVLKISNC